MNFNFMSVRQLHILVEKCINEAAKLDKSADNLRKLADHYLIRSNELLDRHPSYQLALENGVKDVSYKTFRNGVEVTGTISSFSGSANITMPNGDQWNAIGHSYEGTPLSIEKQGYIEFFPLWINEVK